MANTVNVLSYANTFGDWVVTTNNLAKENNDLAANNYVKSNGTLFLNSTTLGLQVANTAIVGGQLQVQGVGSSVYVQNNLRVDTQVYFTNTALGLTNSGQMNVGGIILALSPNTGLAVSNSATVGNTFTVTGQSNLNGVTYVNNSLFVSGNTNISNTVQITGTTTISNNLIVTGNTTIGSHATVGDYLIVTGNTTIGSHATVGDYLIVTNNITGNNVIAANNVTTNIVQANTSVNTTILFTNSEYANNIYSNTITVNTSLNVIGTATFNNIKTPSINVSSLLDANLASGYFNTLQTNGQFTVGGNFVINGSTVYNSNVFTLNAGSSIGLISEFGVNRGSSGANASIRWNESNSYWDVKDVSTGTYYQLTINSTNDPVVKFVQSAYNKANTGSGTFNGTTGQAIANNGVITYSSTNGMSITGSSNTLTINTPQDVRTSSSPTFNALTLTNALPITSGGTGASSSSQALTNILPTGTTSGYVLTTGGPGSFYWAASTGGGGGGATPGTSIQSTRLSYTGNGSTTVYTTPTYIPGNSQLRIYIDGVRQFGSAYTETSNTSVTLSTAPPVNSSILVEVDGYILNPYYANNIAYTVNSNISATANTIQLALDGLTSKVVTYYANTAAPVTFANTVTLTTALAISSGGTGATSQSQALTNILPTGTTAGYVLTTGGVGNFYWSAATGGGGGATPGTTINTTRIYPTVNASQTLFTTPTYTPGTGQLRVYINGVRQFGSEYTETSNTSVTLGTGTTSGDVVLLEVDGYIDNPYYANNISFTVNSNISSTANTIQLALDGLTSKLVTYYANTSSSYSNPSWITSLASSKITGLAASATTDTTNASNISSGTLSTSRLPTIPSTQISGLATSATTDTTNASNISSGTLSTSRLPTIPSTQISGLATSATTDATNASNISSGTLSASRLPYTVNQNVGTGNDVQHNSLGIGTAASGTTGEIRAVDNITAYYSSDIKLKQNIKDIEDPLDKVIAIGGKTFDWTDDYVESHGGEDGYFIRKSDFGVIAQDVEKVFPIAVHQRDDGILAVDYAKLCALAFAAIKELKDEIEILKGNSK